MPLYEYRCKSCGHMFEVLQKFSDRTLRTCKLCHGQLEKLISRTSFQLKGGGWYDQGYGSSKAGSKPAPSKSGTGKTAETSTKSSSPKADGKSGD
jgi:putative FmdB family regulatory protein